MSTTEQIFQSLPIASIRISKTNRKRFSQQALEELAANIKANGLIQPILVRPVSPTETEPEPFEIVCGERRYRASKIAELESINVIYRELSDTQAAELQLIENLQREDPHPMEEAEGYQALMLHSGYTADMLAEKLNKSKSQIYATLKLCNLCKELRDAFFENEKFTRSLALLIARIPVPELQVEAFNEIIDEYGNGEPMSYRDAADHIQTHYNVNLKTAIFSTTDSKLVSEVGSCKSCPKRTDNDPDLADFEKNICTDPKCYESKVIAHHSQVVAKAEKNKLPILRDKDAKIAIAAALDCEENYASDQSKLYSFKRLKNDNDSYKTFISAVGSDKLPEAVAVAVVNVIPTKLYDLGTAQSMLEDLGFCYTELEEENKKLDKQMRGEDPDSEDADDEDSEATTAALDHAAKEDEIKRQTDNEELKRMRIYRAIRARGQLSVESLRHFMLEIDDSWNLEIPQQFHEELYGCDLSELSDRIQYINGATSEQLQLLLIDYVVGSSVKKPNGNWWTKDYLAREDSSVVILLDIAKAEGVDVCAVEREAESPFQILASESKEENTEAKPKAKKRMPKQKASTPEVTETKTITPVEVWPFPKQKGAEQS